MKGKPEDYEELTRLISTLLEGGLSEPDRARLERLLQADPQARRLYMQMVDQEIELSCLFLPAGTAHGKHDNILPMIQPRPGERSRSGRFRWGLAAAAAVLLGGSVLALLISRRPPASETVLPAGPVITEPLVADSWGEDFEQGALRGWIGTLTSNNLPAGSRYAIASVAREHPTAGTAHLVQLPEDWHQGLFALTKTSTLNVTFRVGNRAHINVFMHTIPSDPAASGYQMYQLEGAPFWGVTGEWRTVSIPFSKFTRKIAAEPGGTLEFLGPPPNDGELVTALVFSSVEMIDLVIDRVWVTPMGSLPERTTPIQVSPPP